jgi:hypothetical protein
LRTIGDPGTAGRSRTGRNDSKYASKAGASAVLWP